MALSADIATLRDRALADLVSAHDYYTDTKTAWRMVRNVIAAGQSFTIINTTTGTVTTQAGLAAKAQGYVKEQLAEATFQQFISVFENFVFDFLRLWLVAHPRGLGTRTVDFKTVLELPDKEAITQMVVQKELNELLYKRPAEWFGYLEGRVKIGRPSAAEIERLAEAKASRDVLAHNRGVANATYELKAGGLARYRVGERIDIPEGYHRETWDLVRKVVADVADAAVAKVS